MKPEFTPGPWSFSINRDWTIDADGESIMGDGIHYPWVPEKKADWYLIAAAPDLLEALEGAIEAYKELRVRLFIEQDISVGDSRIANARAAIAKARGQEDK